MRSPLTIACAQPLVVAHDVAGNVEQHVDAIRAADARVVVFPELSLTGYEYDADPIDTTDRRLIPIAEACAETGSLALVGAPIAEGAGRHIAMLAIDGDGVAVAYRKMWLGSEETAHFVPGDEPAVLEVDGRRLGLAICRDTGVPQHAAETAALGIDAYVASVLESVDDSEVQPARARRIAADHGVWVAVASFAGSTGEGFDHAAGGSAIWRPDGTVAAQVGHEVGAIACAPID